MRPHYFTCDMALNITNGACDFFHNMTLKEYIANELLAVLYGGPTSDVPLFWDDGHTSHANWRWLKAQRDLTAAQRWFGYKLLRFIRDSTDVDECLSVIAVALTLMHTKQLPLTSETIDINVNVVPDFILQWLRWKERDPQEQQHLQQEQQLPNK